MIAIGRFHLSSEDIQLLQYLAEGLSNKEIAARLDVADYTVKNRLRRTKRKLGVTGRSQAIEFAVRNGFGVPLDSLSQFASESRSKGRA
jgi:DNA-binding NarL/FixJ family response regulator